jgi:hypothetical protein
MKRGLLLLLVLALLPAPALAQAREPEPRWGALRISKWAALSATAAAAIYGVRTVQGADASYEALERACLAAAETCLGRAANGSYTDPQLEQQYQDVRRQDRRARNALLASQVGVAATVVLFILDLRHARSPADIPYEPRRWRVGATGDGRVALKVTL